MSEKEEGATQQRNRLFGQDRPSERKYQTGGLYPTEIHGTISKRQWYAPFSKLLCRYTLLYSEAFLESHQASVRQDSTGLNQ